jgi:hypothetical protein
MWVAGEALEGRRLMRRKTNRRLRIVTLVTVTILMAVVAGSAVALAEGEDDGSLVGESLTGESLAGHHGGPPTTNPPAKAYIEVHKTVDGGSAKAKYFEVKLDGVTSYHNFSGNGSTGSYTFTVNETGTYTVKEKDKDDYTADPKTQNVVIDSLENQTIDVYITNHYTPPVPEEGRKDWTGQGDTNCEYGGVFHWIFTEGGSDIQSATLHATYVGVTGEFTYPMSQSGGGSWSVWVNNAPSAVSSAWVTFTYLGELGNVVLTISETRCNRPPVVPTGCITVYKEVVGDEGTSPDEFSVQLHDATGAVVGEGSFEGGVITFCGLPMGEYTVTENDPGPEWDIVISPNPVVLEYTGLACTPTTEAPPVVQARVDVTNTLSLGSILVHKTITGKQYPNDPDSVEEFSITLKDAQDQVVGQKSFDENGYAEFLDLVPGVYTIVEDDPGSEWNVTVECGGGATVTNGSQVTREVTNERKLGSLLVTKTITGDNPNNLGFGDFTVVITGPDSDDVVYNGTFDTNGEIFLDELLPGNYNVQEQWLGYPWLSPIQGNGVVVVTADEGGDEAPEPALVEIVNEGSTTTQTSIDTDTTGTTRRTTETTGGTETTETETTTFGFQTSVSDTVFGWVAQADNIQTGGGGTAGWNWGALIALVLSSTMLAGVLTASAVGVARGVL